MKQKFKVGDKVRVSFQGENKEYRCGISLSMLQMEGDILTITYVSSSINKDAKCEVITDGHIYYVAENLWSWTSAMLELVTNNKETMEKTLTLNLEKAREIYNKDNCSEYMKELLLSKFTKEELIKKELPNSWEEFCKNYPRKEEESWINDVSEIEVVGYIYESRNSEEDRNLLPNEETAKAVLAFCQLIQLRDCYNGNWKPNWTDGKAKYCIVCDFNNIHTNIYYCTSRVLAFKSEELRDKFLNNFKDLIEQAKELI